jgi:hypothetical protein
MEEMAEELVLSDNEIWGESGDDVHLGRAHSSEDWEEDDCDTHIGSLMS